MAAYERRGAALERRWADLTDPDSFQSRARASSSVVQDAEVGAKRLSEVLSQTAAALEQSAHLAEKHAQRREQAAQGDDAAKERRIADQARQAAQRARSRAHQWLNVSEDGKP